MELLPLQSLQPGAPTFPQIFEVLPIPGHWGRNKEHELLTTKKWKNISHQQLYPLVIEILPKTAFAIQQVGSSHNNSSMSFNHILHLPHLSLCCCSLRHRSHRSHRVPPAIFVWNLLLSAGYYDILYHFITCWTLLHNMLCNVIVYHNLNRFRHV